MPPDYSLANSMDVYDKIQYTAGNFIQGTTITQLEKTYQNMFRGWRSKDDGSVGVKDFQELIDKMHRDGRLVVYEKPESKEKYVMCARLASSLRIFLKRHVQALLRKHDGEIPLRGFEAIYKNAFRLKFNYHQYNLTGIDHLCEVLNLVVEEGENPPGEKVIKASKIYNLRNRKIYI